MICCGQTRLGTGTLSFLDAYSPVSGTADLVIAKGASLTAAIANMAATDKIDLQGFAFDAGVSGSVTGGTLELSNGTTQTSLHLLGTTMANQFTYTNDGQGGTTIHFHP